MKQKILFKNRFKTLVFGVFFSASLFVTHYSNAQTITSNAQNTHDGFFYSFWTEGGGTASMTLGPAGNYSTKWSNIQNFTAGKGWSVGKKDRVICYEGSYDGGSNGFLAVYGWTKDPLIEYYVVENHGQWNPPGNTSDIISKGSFESDGGTYDIYTSTRTNKPSIIGNATFQQYWSVRRTKRSSGTVTFANHVAKWESLGIKMGTTWDYQIMETEGYGSSGSSNITMRECFSCNATAPVVTASVNYEQGDVASQLTAQGTNLKWYSSASSTTPLGSAPTPSTATTGTTTYYVSQTPSNCESPKAEITVRVMNTYKIFRVSSPLTIDGVIEDVWTNENVKSMDAKKLLSGTVSNAADLSGYAKVLWDDTYLYFLATVTDEAKVNDSETNYDDDGVELYVDINNDKATEYGTNDVQYTFDWNDGTTIGTLPSGRSTANIMYKSMDTDNGYIVEARIPWATLQGAATAGKMIGLDFMINDDDDKGTRDGKLSWNAAEDQAYQNPSLFGSAKLVENELVTVTNGVIEKSISVFPNPVKGMIFVEGFNDVFEYTLLDNSSRVLLQGNSEGTININQVENGMYNLIVKKGDFQKAIKIVVSN